MIRMIFPGALEGKFKFRPARNLGKRVRRTLAAGVGCLIDKKTSMNPLGSFL